jgi:hypothetical protein
MLNPILRLARLCLQISIGRRGPQDMPAVPILLPIMISVYLALSLAIGEALPLLRTDWAPAVAVDTAFLALWYWMLLAVAGRRERYLQTASAVFALQTVLAPLSIATLWLAQWRAATQALQGSSALAAVQLGLTVVSLLWTLLATGHIVRAALERSTTLCLILAFVQMLAESILLGDIYPGH